MSKRLPDLISDRLTTWGEGEKPAPVAELARRYNARAVEVDPGLAVTEQAVHHWAAGARTPGDRSKGILIEVLGLTPDEVVALFQPRAGGEAA